MGVQSTTNTLRGCGGTCDEWLRPFANSSTLEQCNLLDPLSENDLYALHYVYRSRINSALAEFVTQYNNLWGQPTIVHQFSSSVKKQYHTQVTRVQGASCLEKYWTITLVWKRMVLQSFLQVDGGAVAVSQSQQYNIATAVDLMQDDSHGVSLYLAAQ